MTRSTLGPLVRRTALATLALACIAGTSPARAGDAEAGSDVFRKECSECHSVKQGRNKKGPSLFGIVGRSAGTLTDYTYSDALKNAPWVWSEDKLHGYLSQPARQANPGTRMKYSGLDDAKELEDLIAFLASNH